MPPCGDAPQSAYVVKVVRLENDRLAATKRAVALARRRFVKGPKFLMYLLRRASGFTLGFGAASAARSARAGGRPGVRTGTLTRGSARCAAFHALERDATTLFSGAWCHVSVPRLGNVTQQHSC